MPLIVISQLQFRPKRRNSFMISRPVYMGFALSLRVVYSLQPTHDYTRYVPCFGTDREVTALGLDDCVFSENSRQRGGNLASQTPKQRA